jgi:IS5 family transposase
VCKFRHLLERNKLGKVLLTAVNDHLHRSGIKIAKGTIVDATIIGAPSSTKNKDGKRDPEMHQTAQGQQWYFGMKKLVEQGADAGQVQSQSLRSGALESPARTPIDTRMANTLCVA